MSLSVLTARATGVPPIASRAADRGRLRDLREQHRLERLRSARDRREHARPRMIERDLLEVIRKTRRRERPRACKTGRGEPAPRNEVVERAVRAEAEQIAVGVAHPLEARAGHRLVGRRAAQHDQFRRFRADEHGWRLRRGNRLARQRRLDAGPVAIVGQRRETRRQPVGGLPSLAQSR